MMMVYVVIAVAFIGITVYMLNSKMFSGFREGEKKRTFDFVVSLISTFIGFFIALSLNTASGVVTQKANLVKLLTTSSLAIDNTKAKVEGMYLAPAKAGNDILPIIQASPVELPRLYESLETNELANDYWSPTAFQAYILCTDNMRFFINSANAPATTQAQRVRVLDKYAVYLGFAKQVNDLEVQRLKGDLSQSDEEAALQKLMNQINNSK